MTAYYNAFGFMLTAACAVLVGLSLAAIRFWIEDAIRARPWWALAWFVCSAMYVTLTIVGICATVYWWSS